MKCYYWASILEIIWSIFKPYWLSYIYYYFIIWSQLYKTKFISRYFQYYYMKFANSKNNAIPYITHQKRQAAKAIFLSLQKSIQQTTLDAFIYLQNIKQASQKKQSNSKYPINPQMIKKQFISHCAIIIQSRFKGYRQRKKYRLFLPIYRRVKQMLTAIYEGWKVRKIFKLLIIRNQITQIKTKQKQGQISGIRIAKRQLCDDIQRISKKGRWIELLQRQKVTKGNQINNIGKENSSIYSNIKSISIKNIFGNKQLDKNIKNKGKQVVQPKNYIKEQSPIKSKSKSPQKRNISMRKQVSDDRPIKGMSTNTFQEQYIKPKDNNNELKPQQKKKMVKKPIKQSNKNGSKQKSKHQDPSIAKTSRDFTQKSMKQVQLPNQKPKQIKSKQAAQQVMSIKSLHSSKASLPKAKKIQITLAVTATQSLKSSVKSLNPISESSFNYNQLQQPKTPINIPSGKAMIQIMKTYNQKYLQKKESLKQSILGLDFRFSQGVDKHYKNIIQKY